MSVHYKNLKTTIDGQDYYAESVSMSESIDIEYFSPLGTKSSYAFPSNKPKGQIDMTFYITTGSEISNIEDQYGTTGFVSLNAGPFSANNALLNSFSVQGSSNNIIKASASYTYYDQMFSGSTPSKQSVEIKPAHGAASIASLSNLGISGITEFDYSFSQSFDVKYSLGQSEPSRVIFNDGSKELQVKSLLSDVDFESTNLTGSEGLCNQDPNTDGFSVKNLNISLNNLCSENIGSLNISGYLSERSITADPGGEVIETVKVVEKYVREVGCDE